MSHQIDEILAIGFLVFALMGALGILPIRAFRRPVPRVVASLLAIFLIAVITFPLYVAYL